MTMEARYRKVLFPNRFEKESVEDNSRTAVLEKTGTFFFFFFQIFLLALLHAVELVLSL